MTVITREQMGEVEYVECCRIWPVFLYAGIGRCGLCGERPILLLDDDE